MYHITVKIPQSIKQIPQHPPSDSDTNAQLMPDSPNVAPTITPALARCYQVPAVSAPHSNDEAPIGRIFAGGGRSVAHWLAF